MALIHGIRAFTFAHCEKTNTLVLRGMSGMHLHDVVQQEAECRGISAAVWMTEAARERLDARYAGGVKVPHEGPSPDWDCTCGHYFYRTFNDAWVTDYNVYAHVTCLGRTMLHTGGGRTTQYSVDYFLAPESNTQPFVLTNSLAAMAYGYYSPVVAGVQNMQETLGVIGERLGIPILDRGDMRGCPVCLEINNWRKPEEITEKMKRDFFGESYAS